MTLDPGRPPPPTPPREWEGRREPTAASAEDTIGEGPCSPAYPFPRWAYVPGEREGADEPPLAAAKATVPVRFEHSVPPDHPALVYGLALYAEGFHWEAHEVLEAVWMATPQNGADRLAVRAVIQLANAALKLRMGRRAAAIRLLDDARGLADEAARRRPQPGGFAAALDCERLAAGLGEVAAALSAGVVPKVPEIVLTSFMQENA